jgi:hypothetical protein
MEMEHVIERLLAKNGSHPKKMDLNQAKMNFNQAGKRGGQNGKI